MEFFQYAIQAATPENMLWLVIGCIIGAILGALPGMSADTGLAIFIPLTFNLDPTTALIALGAIYVTGAYGGNITAVLVNTPGTSDSVFMTIDGYPMTQRGEGLKAIGVTTFSSFFGGMVGAASLIFLAPIIAKMAVLFGPWELFLVTMMGMVVILGMVKEGVLKGLVSASFGFLCSLIGMDGVTGLTRLSFGIKPILDSLPLLPVVLGLFAVSQMFDLAATHSATIAITDSAIKGSPFLSKKEHKAMFKNNVRSSIVGTIIGIVPGAATTAAAGISYNMAKKDDPHPETFGKGNPQGLACVSAANNAEVTGALIPLLTLGIPGNGTSALFLGALLVHGLAPGTQLFAKTPEIAYGMFFGIIMATFAILLIGLYGAPIYSKITKVPNSILIPIIGSLCVLGAFTYRNLFFDTLLILVFGIIGFYMQRSNFPLAPFVLTFVLGKTSEMAFRRTMIITGGDLTSVMFKPLALALFAIDLILLIWPFWGDIKDYLKKDKTKMV